MLVNWRRALDWHLAWQNGELACPARKLASIACRLAAACCLLAALASTASAGVLGTWSLADPTTNPVGVLPEDWVAYNLGLATDDGSTITALDVSLQGLFRQEWSISEDDGALAPSPSSLSLTSGDSHLTTLPDAVVAVTPWEDNVDGVGSKLRGVWGIRAANQSASLNFAHIVVPRNADLSQFRFDIGVATSNLGGGYKMQGCSLFSAGCQFLEQPLFNQPPVVPPVTPPVVVDPTPPPITVPDPPLVVPPPTAPVGPVAPPVPPVVGPPKPAAVFGTWSVAEPSANPQSGSPGDWVGYNLRVGTNDGSKISAIDVTIHGPLRQEWQFSE